MRKIKLKYRLKLFRLHSCDDLSTEYVFKFKDITYMIKLFGNNLLNHLFYIIFYDDFFDLCDMHILQPHQEDFLFNFIQNKDVTYCVENNILVNKIISSTPHNILKTIYEDRYILMR